MSHMSDAEFDAGLDEYLAQEAEDRARHEAEEFNRQMNLSREEALAEFAKAQQDAADSPIYSLKCSRCKQYVTGPAWREALAPGHVYSYAGTREFRISGVCECCFDEMFKGQP